VGGGEERERGRERGGGGGREGGRASMFEKEKEGREVGATVRGVCFVSIVFVYNIEVRTRGCLTCYRYGMRWMRYKLYFRINFFCQHT
jgi:hypothetical protein